MRESIEAERLGEQFGGMQRAVDICSGLWIRHLLHRAAGNTAAAALGLTLEGDSVACVFVEVR